MNQHSTVGVALVGAGNMAGEHLRVLAKMPNVRLLGIHSRSTAKANALAAKYPDLTVQPNIEALYTNTKADLVLIAVNELACQAVCSEAFQYPWKLLIEKPVGYNFALAKQIEQEATDRGSKAYVALNRRFYGSTLKLQEKLQHITGNRLVTILDQEDTVSALAAGRPPEIVDNWMYANSIHLIDYFTQLCRGEHVKTLILKPWKQRNAVSVISQLEFSSGDIGLYQAVWNAPGPWSVAVSTNQLRAELRPIEQLTLQQAGSRKAELQVCDPIDQKFKPGLWRQAEEALKAAHDLPTALPTLAEANRSMALVASIYETQ